MKRLISILLIFAMSLGSFPVWADDTTKPVITPLSKGVSAPYAGVLLSPEAVARVIADKDAAMASQRLAIQHQLELDAAQQKYALAQAGTTCAADKSILKAQVDANKHQILILDDELKKQASTLSAPLWIGIGAAGGVLLSVITFFAATKLSK